ncbi:MAG: GNAT family N-acetyltransferase [Candidatus Competibacteraceae bacterium]|nr:GNAT family N-acetyltransferase [Candidatus Competibacteraceae bacterium]MBK8898393.1 GNAT family N-acetyltransferase [Candidatus Competibacteraceae bacterium]
MIKPKPFLDRYMLSGFSLAPIEAAEAKIIAGEMIEMDPWRTLNYAAAPLENYLSTPSPALHRYAIKVANDDIAGVVTVRYPWLKGAYLELFGFFPNQQNKGLGTAVLNWLERETESQAANLWVLVSSFNDSAKRFYLRQGFREIGAIEALVSSKSTELLLRKVLRQVA